MLGEGQPGVAVGARQRHPVQGGEEGEAASEGEEGERRRVQRKGLRGDQAGALVFGVFAQLDLQVSSLVRKGRSKPLKKQVIVGSNNKKQKLGT